MVFALSPKTAIVARTVVAVPSGESPVALENIAANRVRRACQHLSMFDEPIKMNPGLRINAKPFGGAVVLDRVRHVAPVGRGKARVFLQNETGPERRPGHRHRAGGGETSTKEGRKIDSKDHTFIETAARIRRPIERAAGEGKTRPRTRAIAIAAAIEIFQHGVAAAVRVHLEYGSVPPPAAFIGRSIKRTSGER